VTGKWAMRRGLLQLALVFFGVQVVEVERRAIVRPMTWSVYRWRGRRYVATYLHWSTVPRDVPWFSYGRQPFGKLPDGPHGDNVIAIADRPWVSSQEAQAWFCSHYSVMS